MHAAGRNWMSFPVVIPVVHPGEGSIVLLDRKEWVVIFGIAVFLLLLRDSLRCMARGAMTHRQYLDVIQREWIRVEAHQRHQDVARRVSYIVIGLAELVIACFILWWYL